MDRAVPCPMDRTDTRSFLTRERNRAGHTADPRPEVCPRDLWWRTSLRLSKECLKLGRLRPGRDTRRLQPRGEEGVANVQQRGWGVDGHHRRSSRPQAQRARTSPSTAATHLDGPRRSLFSYAGSFAPRAVCPGSAERQPPRRVPSSRPVGRASVPGSSMRGCGYAADRLPFAFGGGLPLAAWVGQRHPPFVRQPPHPDATVCAATVLHTHPAGMLRLAGHDHRAAAAGTSHLGRLPPVHRRRPPG